ncbi:MAG TPA: hypothetical protein VGN63_00925 [Flavisolibacter sp.]|jgi:Skp family chaperone for outer membrane proteins|nr:hypothetical protein [Flavisolibacter sp.]
MPEKPTLEQLQNELRQLEQKFTSAFARHRRKELAGILERINTLKEEIQKQKEGNKPAQP